MIHGHWYERRMEKYIHVHLFAALTLRDVSSGIEKILV
jgi:hypothetical protein